MTNTYLITLTPTGKFFFGGDMTFTVNGKETEYTSYIIRSNKFPQQTSLLGMLRFLVLRNDSSVFDGQKQLIKDRDNAANLIGPRSFQNTRQKNDFGVITSIGPCFLQKDGGQIRFLERDYKFKVSFDETKGCTNHCESLDVPVVDGYDPKDGIPSLYLVNDVEVPEEDIFIEDVSNGINRDIATGKTDDNALFKQVCYRLKEGFQFAFYAKIDMDDFDKYSGQLVSVGGDNSQFMIKIEPKECKQDEGKGKCVVLVSPAYLEKDDLTDVRFAITDIIPFKCMKTETQNVKAYNRRNQQYGYIEGLSLYDRGSVFYFKDENDAKGFTEKLEKAHADFYQIGYNHYQVK